MQTTETGTVINGKSQSGGLEKVKAKFSEAEHQAKEKFEETKDLAMKKYDEVQNYIKEADLEKALSDVRAYASRKPLTAIGIGVGLGIIISRLVGGRR